MFFNMHHSPVGAFASFTLGYKGTNRGMRIPLVVPKLINQREAAEMLGLGYSNFKKLEKEKAFQFHRRMLGSSVRYRNIDIVEYIMADNSNP